MAATVCRFHPCKFRFCLNFAYAISSDMPPTLARNSSAAIPFTLCRLLRLLISSFDSARSIASTRGLSVNIKSVCSPVILANRGFTSTPSALPIFTARCEKSAILMLASFISSSLRTLTILLRLVRISPQMRFLCSRMCDSQLLKGYFCSP